ncbi:MAG: PLP-dependent aminotransferase family protein [Gammaproteobacteria bacterium]
MIELDRTGRPLTAQIADRLAALIQTGQLGAGSRLPSVRQMAARLKVSTFTVIAGYDRLIARNLIEARAGAGYFVIGAAKPQAADLSAALADPVDAVGFALQALDSSGAEVRSGSGFLPESWLADVVPAALVARVAKTRNALQGSAPAQGHVGLRRQLSDHLAGVGIAANPAQIITTIGATQALDLLLRTLLQAGDSLIVEDPGYLFYSAQARALDLNLVPVPRLADGPDLAAFDEALKSFKPKAFVTQTLLHNPTGSTTSAANCHRLLSLAESHGLAVIEDDVYGSIAPKGATRLAQLDGLRHTYYVGSFSKLLSPALRVGFMAVPREAVDRVVGQKILSVLATPSFGEVIVEAVLDSGRYLRHTQQVSGKLAQHRQRAQALLADAGVTLTPADGMFLWGRFEPMKDSDNLVRRALEAGILLAKGSLFSPTGSYTDYLRFNVAHSCDVRLGQFLRDAAPLQPKAEVRYLRPRIHG